MNRCRRCNLSIRDNSIRCPLCSGVLEVDIKGKNAVNLEEEKTALVDEENIDEESNICESATYPDITQKVKRIKFVIKLFVFCSFVVEAALMVINYLISSEFSWSLICGVALVYACFTVAFSFQRNTGHRTKVVIQTLLAMVLAVVIDKLTGYIGWSVDFFIPSALILMNVLAVIMMFVNNLNWQNYILMQIIVSVVSLLYLICIPLGILKYELLAIIAAIVSVLCFFGIQVFGGRRAKIEVKRRFHI